MTEYEALQRQRHIERQIRRWKREAAAMGAAGQDPSEAQAKVNQWQARQRDFVRQTGLKRDYSREQIAGRTNGVAKRAKRDILSGARFDGILVTDEAIQRVPLVSPAGWSRQRAERLQEAHRELLRAVKDRPVGTEAGRIYNLDMSPQSDLIIGKLGGYQIIIPDCETAYIAVHSHPDGQIFSESDIKKFIFLENMEMLTAVGNDGVLYAIRKMPEYDGFQVYQRYCELSRVLQECVDADDMSKYIHAVEEFLDGGSAYGLEFIKGGA